MKSKLLQKLLYACVKDLIAFSTMNKLGQACNTENWNKILCGLKNKQAMSWPHFHEKTMNKIHACNFSSNIKWKKQSIESSFFIKMSSLFLPI